MNKINCPHCGLANWSSSTVCVRCKTEMGIPVSEDFVSYSGPKAKHPHESHRKNRSLSGMVTIIGIVLIVMAVYIVTTRPSRKNNENIDTVLPLVSITHGNSKGFQGLDQNARDAAFWKVTAPDTAKLSKEYKDYWEGTLGDVITVREEDPQARRSGPVTNCPYGVVGPCTIVEQFKNPGNSRSCGGKVENIEIVDYCFDKPGEHILLTVRYEGDIQWRIASDPKTCGDLRSHGRQTVDVPYVWSESTPGFGRWAKLNELNGDPKFKDSVLKPDPEDIRAKEIAENEKFEKERQEKEAKREEKLLRKRLHIIGSN